jgi:chemosensory pili system protein ChpA (sensor histidine kinase/response regulator)
MFASAPTTGSGTRSVRQELNRKSQKMLHKTTSIQPREKAFNQAAQRARILIVVDNRLAGRQLARMLMKEGYVSVRAATDAGRALVIAQHYQPDIVFLDVTLAGDAYELARGLRQQAGQAELRLIALTNSIEHSTREQARSAGFERWLVTPVTQEDLDGLLRDKSGLT